VQLRQAGLSPDYAVMAPMGIYLPPSRAKIPTATPRLRRNAS